MNRTLGLKLVAIGVVTVVIWIALVLVNGTIDDRRQYRDEAVKSIEASYAGPQTLIGPVLVRPYTQTTETMDEELKGKTKKVVHTEALNAISFPHELYVRGAVKPDQRRHGLYKVTVYEFEGRMEGSIDVVQPKTEGTVVWGEPYLALSVRDVRGIVGTPAVTVNGVPEAMVQGAPAIMSWQPNLTIPLRGVTMLTGRINVAIDLNLAGTVDLNIAPVGSSNHVELRSTWSSPLFAGQFLPRTRAVGVSGFTAMWDVSSLATGTQAEMQARPLTGIDTMEVSLLTPIDPYKLSDRATKYGILFVVLTFGGFFLFEMIKRLPIHPVQYLLVGFGLAIFFLLLISFSEHIPFAAAYGIASAASIGLLTFYLSFVLQSALRGLAFGGMLLALYAAVYGLLISEDNSLILGALLLFAVLAGVMAVTRKVDWYRGNALSASPPLAG